MKEPRRFIQILAGPRQTGKTTLARQIAEFHTLPTHYSSAGEPGLNGNIWIEQQWEIDRKVRALLAAGAEHPRASLHLITLDPGQVVVPEAIRIHPAWQWFLEPEME